MEKRHQVFVSSTYDDLKEERAKAITALLNIDCIPCGMEYFPAADEDAWQCIERLIPECDYYVIILAGRYGSVPRNATKSYIHQEYELAVQHGIPIIGLLHEDPMKLPAEKCEQDPKSRKKLVKFRADVSRKLCRFWSTGDHLASQLLSSLTKQIKNKPRPGWVRSNTLASGEAKDEIIKLRRELEAQSMIINDYRSKETEEENELASGADEVKISGSSHGTDESGARGRTRFSVLTTWDNLLKFIRRNHSESWDEYDFQTSLTSEIAANIEYSSTFHYYIDPTVKIDDEYIKMVLLQFNALGIFCKRGSKWDFTSKGLAAASRMLAKRKGQGDFWEGDWFMLSESNRYPNPETPNAPHLPEDRHQAEQGD